MSTPRLASNNDFVAEDNHGPVGQRGMKAWYVGYPDADGGEVLWADDEAGAYRAYLDRHGYDTEDVAREDLDIEHKPTLDGEPRPLTPQDWLRAGMGSDCHDCGNVTYPSEWGGHDSEGNIFCCDCWRDKHGPDAWLECWGQGR